MPTLAIFSASVGPARTPDVMTGTRRGDWGRQTRTRVSDGFGHEETRLDAAKQDGWTCRQGCNRPAEVDSDGASIAESDAGYGNGHGRMGINRDGQINGSVTAAAFLSSGQNNESGDGRSR